MTKERHWETGEFKYEGLPLYLRHPQGLDYDTLQKSYPQLIAVTHFLSEVNGNGVPNADYNDSLIGFDGFVIDFLEKSGNGITVLVETFGGKRNYYMYSKADFDPRSIERALHKSYPESKVEIFSKKDSNWGFVRKYAADWKF